MLHKIRKFVTIGVLRLLYFIFLICDLQYFFLHGIFPVTLFYNNCLHQWWNYA